MTKQKSAKDFDGDRVEASSGCVFCDLGLDTAQAGLGGGHYHEINSRSADQPARRFIRCPLKS